jgi:hypothetical protein
MDDDDFDADAVDEEGVHTSSPAHRPSTESFQQSTCTSAHQALGHVVLLTTIPEDAVIICGSEAAMAPHQAGGMHSHLSLQQNSRGCSPPTPNRLY